MRRTRQDEPPTERNREVYEAVQDYLEEHHYAPSQRELAEILAARTGERVSHTRIRHHLKVLAEKGYIAFDVYVARSLSILKPLPDAPASGNGKSFPLR